jgi:hypothetical protein
VGNSDKVVNALKREAVTKVDELESSKKGRAIFILFTAVTFRLTQCPHTKQVHGLVNNSI